MFNGRHARRMYSRRELGKRTMQRGKKEQPPTVRKTILPLIRVLDGPHLFFNSGISAVCSRASSVFHSHFISQSVLQFLPQDLPRKRHFWLDTLPNRTLTYINFSYAMNILNRVWSKNLPLREAGDHAAYSGLSRCNSRFTFGCLADSIQGFLHPILAKAVWVIGPDHFTVGSLVVASRKGSKVEPGAGFCGNAGAEKLVHHFVSRIKVKECCFEFGH